MNVIKAFCDNAVARARALEEAGFQLTEAIAQKISPMWLFVLAVFIIYGGFLQVRHERMVNQICYQLMLIQSIQAPSGSSKSASRPETFRGCLDRLGAR